MFDTVISGGLLVSSHNDYRVFRGSIGIQEGEIVLVTEKTLSPVDARQFIDASERIVMPGLINAHCHGDMAAARGIGGGMTLRDQMRIFGEHGWFFPVLSAEDRYYSRMHTYCEALLSGTTTLVENMYWSLGGDSVKAFQQTGLHGALAEDVRYDFMKSDEFLTDEMLRDMESNCRAAGCISVLGTLPEEEFTDHRLRKTARIIREGSSRFTSHLAETQWRYDSAVQNFGKSPVKVLEDYQLLNERYFGSHGIYFDEEDIAILAKRNVSIVNTPICELKIADGLAPIRELLDHGVNVALGTDGAMWNNSNDIFREMKCMALAHTLKNGVTVFTPQEILDMATINGARALGLSDRIGTLEVGKQADIILVDAAAPHLTPLYTGKAENITSALVYCATGQDVTDVFVSGNFIVNNRKLTTCNIREIQAKVYDSAQKVINELKGENEL